MAQAPATAPATQTTRPTQPARPGRTFALLVGGMSGSPVYARRHQDWLKRFHALLTKAGAKAEDIVAICGDKDFKDPIVKGIATSDAIIEALADMAAKVGPQDQFVLVIVGHGSSSDEVPALVLPGPDLRGEALAKALSAVGGNQVVLDLSGCSGQFLKPLAKKGRVNISALSPDDTAEPVFAEFFLRGMESGRADADKNGTVTLLEAYNWAAYQTALWISRQTATEDKTWVVDGKESVEIFKKLCSGAEGQGGARTLDPSSDATKEDAIVDVILPSDRADAKAWGDRRIIIEHAMVEDLGLETGVSALRGEKGHDPVAPAKAGEEGFLAGQTVLGKPAN
ncbi:MAG: hypothetical protein ACE15C_07450 [Phycisphaerae bacterium]